MKAPTDLVNKPYILPATLVSTAILTILLGTIDSRVAGPGGHGVFYLQMSFTKPAFEAILAAWGPDGIRLFIKTMWLDYIYPLSYSLLIASFIAFLQRKGEEIRNAWLLIPFIAGFFDMVENSIHLYILLNHAFSKSLIMTASTVALAKWLLLLASFGVMMKKWFSFRKKMRKNN